MERTNTLLNSPWLSVNTASQDLEHPNHPSKLAFTYLWGQSQHLVGFSANSADTQLPLQFARISCWTRATFLYAGQNPPPSQTFSRMCPVKLKNKKMEISWTHCWQSCRFGKKKDSEEQNFDQRTFSQQETCLPNWLSILELRLLGLQALFFSPILYN